MPEAFYALGIFLIIDILTEIVATTLYYQHINNLPLLHIYTLLEFISFSFYYRATLRERQIFSKYFYVFVILVSLFIVLNSVFFQPLTEFNSNAKTLVQAILMGYGIYHLFSVFGKINLSEPAQFASCVVSMAVIIYNAGSFFIFMFSNVLLENNSSRTVQYGFWMLNSLLFLIFQILILFSLWKVASRPKKFSY